MLPFRRILFPVDYSPQCTAVVPYIADMMCRFTAEPTLLHVYEPHTYLYSGLTDADPRYLEDMEEREETKLSDFAQMMLPGQGVEILLERGDPGAVIGDVVRSTGTDLVMMPTRGCGALRRLLLGSTTAKVLHDVSTPVWTSTGHALDEHQPGIPYRSIVCALDEGEEMRTILKAGVTLADAYHADLSLVHVVEMPAGAVDLDYSALKRNLMDLADETIRNLKDSMGVDVPHSVVDADVAQGVRNAAVMAKADLIVTGRGHAQGRLSRWWSHLYTIVRQSPCPVLSV